MAQALSALVVVLLAPVLAAQVDLEGGFRDPLAVARPHTWWHWMIVNVTREGISADLEAMTRNPGRCVAAADDDARALAAPLCRARASSPRSKRRAPCLQAHAPQDIVSRGPERLPRIPRSAARFLRSGQRDREERGARADLRAAARSSGRGARSSSLRAAMRVV